MRLGAEVVDLVRLCLPQDIIERAGVVQIPVEHTQPRIKLVRILVQMVDALSVERRGTADNSKNLIALFEQKLDQVGTVLPRYPGDKRTFSRHKSGEPRNFQFLRACNSLRERLVEKWTIFS